MRVARRCLAGALIVGTVLACGGGGQSGPAPHGVRVPSKLEIAAGEAQSGLAGAELPQPVVVRVLDSTGAPIEGQIVNFVVTAGGGQVFAGVSTSNAVGEARERWTLGLALGPQQLEARAVDSTTGAALVFATFNAVAVAGPPAEVRVVNETLVATQGVIPAAGAMVVDAAGLPVAGVPVTFVVTSGDGRVEPGTAVTDDAGVAYTTCTLGRPGDPRMGAHVAGLAPAEFVPHDAGAFSVTVQVRGSASDTEPGGRVFTDDGEIDCGAGVAAQKCSAQFFSGTTVVLKAVASGIDLLHNQPYQFAGWFGDCAGVGDCTLAGNADKFVVARFASPSATGHGNYSDPALHGPEYSKFVSGDPAALRCTQCHGASLQGQGIAVSCAACHSCGTGPFSTGGAPCGAARTFD